MTLLAPSPAPATRVPARAFVDMAASIASIGLPSASKERGTRPADTPLGQRPAPRRPVRTAGSGRSRIADSMWLGLALIVWLWGVALYLLVYYVALWIWGAHGLYELLGERFYNAHVPTGGWEPALYATIVFSIVFAIVACARRAAATAADLVTRRAHVSQRVALAAANAALIAVAVPTVITGADAVRGSIARAIDRAETARANAEAGQRTAEERAHDPYFLGEHGSITLYGSNMGLAGESLLLASDGTYRRSYWTDGGGGDVKEGRFQRRDNLVIIEPVHSDGPDYSLLSNQLLEVHWGARSYLVGDTPSALESFCSAVNVGSEPRSKDNGAFLLRDSDETIAVTGLPSLPEPWSTYLLRSPLQGHTLEIAPDGTAWVDLGARQGVRKPLQLFLVDAPPVRSEWRERYRGDDRVQPLAILDVEQERCRVRYGGCNPPDLRLPMSAGLLVTSRAPARE